MIVRASDVEPVSRPGGISSKSLISGDTPSAAVTMLQLTLQPGATLERHKHNAEEAFYVLEGKGVAFMDENEYPVEPGAAILASTGRAHGFRNEGDKPLVIACFFPVIFPKRVD